MVRCRTNKKLPLTGAWTCRNAPLNQTTITTYWDDGVGAWPQGEACVRHRLPEVLSVGRKLIPATVSLGDGRGETGGFKGGKRGRRGRMGHGNGKGLSAVLSFGCQLVPVAVPCREGEGGGCPFPHPRTRSTPLQHTSCSAELLCIFPRFTPSVDWFTHLSCVDLSSRSNTASDAPGARGADIQAGVDMGSPKGPSTAIRASTTPGEQVQQRGSAGQKKTEQNEAETK